MVIRAATQRPTKLAIGFSDRMFVDAGMAFPHQAVFSELPVLVTIVAKQLTAVVAIFVRVTDSEAITGKGPQLLDEPVFELLVSLAGQEGFCIIAVLCELDAVARSRIERTGKRHLGGIATIPAAFGKADLCDGTLSGEWGNGTYKIPLRVILAGKWRVCVAPPPGR